MQKSAIDRNTAVIYYMHIPAYMQICILLKVVGGKPLGGFIPQSICPKCGVIIYMDNDVIGWFEYCLQYGFTCDPAEMTGIGDPSVNANTAENLNYSGI